MIGVINNHRSEARPFTDNQIALLETFADQAVIAIQNTRLFEAEQARTKELTEALDQQTATSEVLAVISRSPGKLAPVFQAVLENGTWLCGAKFGALYLCERDGLRVVAMHNAPPAFAQARAGTVHPPQYTALWQSTNTKQPAQKADVTVEKPYIERGLFDRTWRISQRSLRPLAERGRANWCDQNL